MPVESLKCSCGMDENSCGSGSPIVICVWRIAAKYTLIVCGDNLNMKHSNTARTQIQEMGLIHYNMNKNLQIYIVLTGMFP